MTTAVAETPVVATGGAKVVLATKRSILAHDEFRCKRPTRVAKGADAAATCGAEAWVKVTYPGEVERFYCAHHYTAEEPTIVTVAVSVLDERAFINKAPSASS